MSDFRENVEKLNVRGIVMASIMTAFGLVVALSWKDAINALVARIIPSGSGDSLLSLFITASAVTLLVVVLASVALRINRRLEGQLERMADQLEKMGDLFERD
jgi:biopolymer transport protein ExbB/TolQ